jgi:hypothetical protein
MRKASDAVRDIVEQDWTLRVGLAQRLLNLSQVARHIRSAVEARTQKTVELGAITMALSRLRAELPPLASDAGIGLADRITVQRGLAVLTFTNTATVHRGLLTLQQEVRSEGGHLTLTEGMREITLIMDEARSTSVSDMVGEKPLRTSRSIASLSVSLTEANLTTPGILYRLLQPLALQGISLAEVASTTSEFHIYIAERDVMLALESLYGAFR